MRMNSSDCKKPLILCLYYKKNFKNLKKSTSKMLQMNSHLSYCLGSLKIKGITVSNNFLRLLGLSLIEDILMV